jgi:hypothetical protein
MAGQALGDLLSGAAGHPINRPALDAAVMQGQALAGLRTAQTEDALQNAQRLREENEASDNLEGALMGSKDADGKNLFTPSQAHFTATQMKFLHGGAEPALQAWQAAQKAAATATLGNTALLGTPEQTAAQQAIQGKVAEPIQVHPEYATLPGAFKPDVQQTPEGVATTAEKTASANLKNTEAANPGAFHPGGGPSTATDQQMLGDLIKAGVIDPQHVSRYNASPGALKAAWDVLQSSPGFTGTGHAAIQASERDWMSNSTQSSGGKVTRGNAAMNHIEALRDLSKALQNGDLRLWNYAKNELGAQIGDPSPQNLQLAAHFVGSEVTSFLSAAGGTKDDRQKVESAFGVANSPEAATGAADTGEHFLAGQFDAFRTKYHSRPDAPSNFAERFLTPESKAALDRFDKIRASRTPQGGGAGPAAEAPPINLLKEGHITHFDNGQSWALRNGQPVQVQ